MKIVFCGTPQFAVPTLERLATVGFHIELVVTQPDRPRGRGMGMSFSPIKLSALKMGLRVEQPEKIRNNETFRRGLQEISPEAIVVVGYGKLIPKWMLEMPPLGNINLHASLLPKYRGAAPIQWAIAKGESITGNTTMLLDEGLDTGGILMQQQESISESDTSLTLAPRLAAAGAELIVQTLRGLEGQTIKPQPQDESFASLAPILKKEDGRIDFKLSAQTIHDRLRGFQPWPGAFTTFRGKTLNILSAKPENSGSQLTCGEIVVQGDALRAGCGKNSMLTVLESQFAGKRSITAREFINGYKPKPGELLGN